MTALSEYATRRPLEHSVPPSTVDYITLSLTASGISAAPMTPTSDTVPRAGILANDTGAAAQAPEPGGESSPCTDRFQAPQHSLVDFAVSAKSKYSPFSTTAESYMMNFTIQDKSNGRAFHCQGEEGGEQGSGPDTPYYSDPSYGETCWVDGPGHSASETTHWDSYMSQIRFKVTSSENGTSWIHIHEFWMCPQPDRSYP